jgi:tetratricopeptide (TPR) repeat protein
MGTIRRGMPALGALMVLAALVPWTGVRLDARRAAFTPPDELVYLPDASRLRPLALGYDNVLADLVWFRTIDYFGAHYASDKAYPWLASMCELVTDLDPRATHVYRFAALILPWEAHDPDAAIRLLEKGTRALPHSWSLYYHLGVINYLFKGDYDAAAAYLTRAAESPKAPPFVARFAAILQTKRQGPQTTIAILEEMRNQASSKETREVVERSLSDAQAAWDVQLMEDAVRKYRAQAGRLPATLAEVVDAGFMRFVPTDRYGGVYQVDPATGAVRSSTGKAPLALHTSPLAARLQKEAQ